MNHDKDTDAAGAIETAVRDLWEKYGHMVIRRGEVVVIAWSHRQSQAVTEIAPDAEGGFSCRYISHQHVREEDADWIKKKFRRLNRKNKTVLLELDAEDGVCCTIRIPKMFSAGDLEILLLSQAEHIGNVVSRLTFPDDA